MHKQGTQQKEVKTDDTLEEKMQNITLEPKDRKSTLEYSFSSDLLCRYIYTMHDRAPVDTASAVACVESLHSRGSILGTLEGLAAINRGRNPYISNAIEKMAGAVQQEFLLAIEILVSKDITE